MRFVLTTGDEVFTVAEGTAGNEAWVLQAASVLVIVRRQEQYYRLIDQVYDFDGVSPKGQVYVRKVKHW